MLKSLSFYIPISVDILAILISFYFIISDYIRQSSSSNGLLTLITLLMCGYVALSWYLHSKNMSLGTIMAWVPAVPLLLYGIFILMFVILKPDMR